MPPSINIVSFTVIQIMEQAERATKHDLVPKPLLSEGIEAGYCLFRNPGGASGLHDSYFTKRPRAACQRRPVLVSMVAFCYHPPMAVNLHIRDVPDEVHRILTERSHQRGMSLRSYLVEMLTEHCSMPTLEQWVADLGRLPTTDEPMAAAEAVRQARGADDREVLGGRSGGA